MKEWNHNIYYHKEIFKNIPSLKSSVLDIGSGLGELVHKLSPIFNNVTALEPDLPSINQSKLYNEINNNISFIHNSFLELDFKNEKFDYIIASASIHHMDFICAIDKMKALLKPNGKFIIVGLYKECSLIDFGVSLLAIIPNMILNLVSKKSKNETQMVIKIPQLSLKEIKTYSNEILGDYIIKRHLFWRYSLVYINS